MGIAGSMMAQVTFSDGTSDLTTTTYSGVPMGVLDMNGDKLDDIVRIHDVDDIYINYQQASGGFTEYAVPGGGGSNEWSFCAADFDENGYNDFLIGNYTRVKTFQANGTGTAYTSNTVSDPGWIFVQGSNFIDLNNDGMIDIFACNDDDENYTYNGDGTGNFTYNVSYNLTAPGSDGSGNYASIWTDYDNDGDLDMYLSKCRQGVSNPNDARRINELFINDGAGNYTPNSISTSPGPGEAGLRDSAQSWLTDFNDYDNDGDMDAFIVNHDRPHRLVMNNGNGTFTDVTAGSGLSTPVWMGIQGFFRDFDNDGWLDLIVVGDEEHLYWNNGDGTFTEAVNPFGANTIESMAIGDVNHDGFLDFYAGYASLFNSPSSTIPDKLFINDGNSNNWIAFDMEGTVSNINGIGARVEIHGPFGIQIREIRSGEGYGVQNTFAQHFGLGTGTQVDQVVVKWPSGIVDVIPNPTINDFTTIVEGSTVGVDEILAAVDVTVYPNPFDEAATLHIRDYDFAQGDLELTVIDINGKVVSSEQVSNEYVVIDGAALPSGIYIYELSSEGKPFHRERLIVK